jgi:prepilin-type N-terminal cleavage/methylation domain-containing protein
MNAARLRFKPFRDKGMTLVEVMIALMLLVAFMGLYVAVTEVAGRFFGETEEALATLPQDQTRSHGLLVDHALLQTIMERLADTLSQPGIEPEEIAEIISSGCSDNPVASWSLPGPNIELPPGYRICLNATPLSESPVAELLKPLNFPQARPGIYVLQASPNEVSATAQPTRRLFCRPKPFCQQKS